MGAEMPDIYIQFPAIGRRVGLPGTCNLIVADDHLCDRLIFLCTGCKRQLDALGGLEAMKTSTGGLIDRMFKTAEQHLKSLTVPSSPLANEASEAGADGVHQQGKEAGK